MKLIVLLVIGVLVLALVVIGMVLTAVTAVHKLRTLVVSPAPSKSIRLAEIGVGALLVVVVIAVVGLLAWRGHFSPRLHGRVVDERGEPIAGAKVYYNRWGGYFESVTGAAMTTTDSDGRFETIGRGGSLCIQSIRAEGYRVPVHTQPPDCFVYLSEWKDFTYQRPKVFSAWKVPLDMTVPYEVGRASTGVTLSLDDGGRSRDVVVLHTYAKHERTSRAGPWKTSEWTWDKTPLRFELLTLELNDDEPAKSKWTVRITVLNGGGLVRIAPDDLFAARPPQTGYEQSLEITQAVLPLGADLRRWMFWYAYVADQRKYGRIGLSFSPPDAHSVRKKEPPTLGISISASFNLSGQRYLLPYEGRTDS